MLDSGEHRPGLLSTGVLSSAYSVRWGRGTDLPDMAVRIGDGANIAPWLLRRHGNNCGSGLLGLVDELIDGGFATCGDTDEGLAVATWRDIAVANDPAEPARWNKHEAKPVVESEL